MRELEFNNIGLEGEIRVKDQELVVLRQRHVPLLKNEGKKYGITIIAKNDRVQNIRLFQYAVNMVIGNRKKEWCC